MLLTIFFLSLGQACDGSDLSYMNAPDKQSLFLRGLTTQEVISSFLSLSNSRATDAFGIQIAPVKFVIDIIASCLEYIFNLCLSTGVFPRSMQTAKVTVIFKKGDKNDLSNYRPVSVLPVFFERFREGDFSTVLFVY